MAQQKSEDRVVLDLKQANGAELWAKIVACGLIGSGPARLSLVRERFGEGMRCVEFTHVDGAGFWVADAEPVGRLGVSAGLGWC